MKFMMSTKCISGLCPGGGTGLTQTLTKAGNQTEEDNSAVDVFPETFRDVVAYTALLQIIYRVFLDFS